MRIFRRFLACFSSKALRASVAAACALGLAGVAVGAPLSANQASAEVIPLQPGQVMDQKLMAEATSHIRFELPSIEVKKVQSVAPAKSSLQSAIFAAPAVGMPDPGSAQEIAMKYVGEGGEFNCLVALWNKESHWNVYAHNSGSGAYGIPQALPGSKMASAGSDWQTNPDTQIRWGLGYIRARYGSPCAAWAKSQSSGWY